METKTKPKKEFDTIKFVRQVRENMTKFYHEDKERYVKNIRKSMEDFLATRANKGNS